MSPIRLRRVESSLREEISWLFVQGRLKDPRIHGRVTVLSVEASRDLRYAKVYVSILGDAEEERETLAVLNRAAGFVQREVALRVRMKNTPRIAFLADHSIQRGVELVHRIDSLVHRADASSAVEPEAGTEPGAGTPSGDAR